jgi:hypothetical protein
MRILPLIIKRHGFTFEQILRRGNLAICKQRLRPSVGCLAFEVVRIRQRPASHAFSREFPAYEQYPNDEDWGTYGWTLPTIEAAQAKLAALEAADADKIASPTAVNAAA